MGAFTDKHIKANAMMPQAVLIDKAFIFSSPFLPPSYDVSEPYYVLDTHSFHVHPQPQHFF